MSESISPWILARIAQYPPFKSTNRSKLHVGRDLVQIHRFHKQTDSNFLTATACDSQYTFLLKFDHEAVKKNETETKETVTSWLRAILNLSQYTIQYEMKPSFDPPHQHQPRHQPQPQRCEITIQVQEFEYLQGSSSDPVYHPSLTSLLIIFPVVPDDEDEENEEKRRKGCKILASRISMSKRQLEKHDTQRKTAAGVIDAFKRDWVQSRTGNDLKVDESNKASSSSKRGTGEVMVNENEEQVNEEISSSNETFGPVRPLLSRGGKESNDITIAAVSNSTAAIPPRPRPTIAKPSTSSHYSSKRTPKLPSSDPMQIINILLSRHRLSQNIDYAFSYSAGLTNLTTQQKIMEEERLKKHLDGKFKDDRAWEKDGMERLDNGEWEVFEGEGREESVEKREVREGGPVEMEGNVEPETGVIPFQVEVAIDEQENTTEEDPLELEDEDIREIMEWSLSPPRRSKSGDKVDKERGTAKDHVNEEPRSMDEMGVSSNAVNVDEDVDELRKTPSTPPSPQVGGEISNPEEREPSSSIEIRTQNRGSSGSRSATANSQMRSIGLSVPMTSPILGIDDGDNEQDDNDDDDDDDDSRTNMKRISEEDDDVIEESLLVTSDNRPIYSLEQVAETMKDVRRMNGVKGLSSQGEILVEASDESQEKKNKRQKEKEKAIITTKTISTTVTAPAVTVETVVKPKHTAKLRIGTPIVSGKKGKRRLSIEPSMSSIIEDNDHGRNKKRRVVSTSEPVNSGAKEMDVAVDSGRQQIRIGVTPVKRVIEAEMTPIKLETIEMNSEIKRHKRRSLGNGSFTPVPIQIGDKPPTAQEETPVQTTKKMLSPGTVEERWSKIKGRDFVPGEALPLKLEIGFGRRKGKS